MVGEGVVSFCSCSPWSTSGLRIRSLPYSSFWRLSSGKAWESRSNCLPWELHLEVHLRIPEMLCILELKAFACGMKTFGI